MIRREVSDGTRIHIVHFGGEGPPLLLCHATGFCAEVWSPFAQVLSSSFDCWAVDFRGHGASERPISGTYEWSGFACDVQGAREAILQHTGTSCQFGIGHSMGGAALILDHAHHSSFEALWLFEPIVIPDSPFVPEGSHPLAEGALRRRRHFSSRSEAIANFSSKPPMNEFDQRALTAYGESGFIDTDAGVTLSCRATDESTIYRMGSQHEAWRLLPAQMLRVAVVRGKESPFSPAAFASHVAEALPSGELIEFPHLGHFGPLQDPKTLAVSARDWLLGDVSGSG